MLDLLHDIAIAEHTLSGLEARPWVLFMLVPLIGVIILGRRRDD